jgi:hydroxyacylglutathione hydrolase
MGERLIHEILPVGMLSCNCSIVGDAVTHEAIVIDPGDEVGRILAVLKKHGLSVQSILSTHTHIDHVGGLALLHQSTGAPVYMHEKDLELYRNLDIQARWLQVPTPVITKVEKFLREGDAVRWGDFQAQVLHTPGHTEGSICLYLPRSAKEATGEAISEKPPIDVPRLFAGDTLFAGSIGRTDLWGGSLDAIMASLQGTLMKLPDETVVYPGHGPATTIGEERESNPFLRAQ